MWVVAFTLGFGWVALPEADERDDNGSSAATRFIALKEPPLTQYRALRRMHAKSERFGQEAWMDVRTVFDENGFRYEILSERGSEYVRNKVMKAVLKREQELIEQGETERCGITAQNYEFTDAPSKGDGLVYVLLKPKRKDVLLVDGRMVLSGDGSDLLRVEGRLSKNPSFWTSLVNVIRTYAKVDGVRVPVTTESIAKVKFAGTSRMDVQYEYEQINGRPVNIAARR